MDVRNQEVTDQYAIYHGDCVDVMANMPDASVGLSVFSPPFADLYTYSDEPQDLGNCQSYDEFFKHFEFVAQDLMRVTKPGRIVAMHCIDIPAMKERDGYIGLKDFPGDMIRLFERMGFIYHSRHIIWKDPLIEAVRTKALGLAHKQLVKDSTQCRAGLPDYLLAFRVPGENPEPVEQGDGLSVYHGANDPGGSGVKRSHNIWRAYASPVWMDVRQTNTLSYKEAREDDDEKHICPLQLDVIERAIALWSNKGDIVWTPFMGIGSEVYVSVKRERKGVGAELKESYYSQARKNIQQARKDRKDEENTLF